MTHGTSCHRVTPIRKAVVCIPGFTQTEGQRHGLFKAYIGLSVLRSPTVVVELREWDSDWDKVAESLWLEANGHAEDLEIIVIAYSFGCGWGVQQFNKALSARGMKIKVAVFSDPVFRRMDRWPVRLAILLAVAFALGGMWGLSTTSAIVALLLAVWRTLNPYSKLVAPSTADRVWWFYQRSPLLRIFNPTHWRTGGFLSGHRVIPHPNKPYAVAPPMEVKGVLHGWMDDIDAFYNAAMDAAGVGDRRDV